MRPRRWQELEELFQAARAQPPEQRASFLQQQCSDPELREEVESLLAHQTCGDRLLILPPGSAPPRCLQSISLRGRLSLPARSSVPIASSSRWAPAVWAKSTARATHA